MAKTVHDDVLDGAFDVLDQANLMIACSAQPTSSYLISKLESLWW